MTTSIEKAALRAKVVAVLDAVDALGVSDPAPTPVDCVLSAWGPWVPTTAWSACVGGVQSRTEGRSRTIITAPANGGAPCGPLTESRLATQPCVVEPPPPPGPITSAMPDFVTTPTITSKQDGPWFVTDTWDAGRLPRADDIVRVAHEVTYAGVSGESLKALGITGSLRFNPTTDTRLKVTTLQIPMGGKLQIGTDADPVEAGVKAELIFADRPLDLVADPFQWGNGLLVKGDLEMCGAEVHPTFIRLARAPKAGDMTLLLSEAPEAGWDPGARLVLPDSRQVRVESFASTEPPHPLPLWIEESVIASISGDVITLTEPLIYDHPAAYDVSWNGTAWVQGDIVAMPHVANLSRNVVLRSENPAGVRGHMLATGMAMVDVCHCLFEGMGRTKATPLNNTTLAAGVVTNVGTNQIGRYPVHFHHLEGPTNPTNTGFQYRFEGNAVVDGLKWSIAVHNSHWGNVTGNVCYKADGAAILTEQGNERGNVFDNNFACHIGTPLRGWYQPVYGGVTGANRPEGFRDFGWEGSAFWFSGNEHIVTNNVATNCAYAGLMFNARAVAGHAYNRPVLPKFRGARMDSPGDWIEYWRIPDPAPSIIECRNNESYACAEAVWTWFCGDVGTLANTKGWHIRQEGLSSSRNATITFDGLDLVNDPRLSIASRGIDLDSSVYTTGQVTLKGKIRVQGYAVGLRLPANLGVALNVFPGAKLMTLIDGDVLLRNYVNIIEISPRYPKTTILRGVKLERFPVTFPSFPASTLPPVPTDIVPIFEAAWINTHVTQPSRFVIFNHNGVAGANYEFFMPEQAPDYVMKRREYPPGTIDPMQNCPTQGLTNQQCMVAHGVANLGRVATCSDTTTFPTIKGFMCPLEQTFEEVLASVT